MSVKNLIIKVSFPQISEGSQTEKTQVFYYNLTKYFKKVKNKCFGALICERKGDMYFFKYLITLTEQFSILSAKYSIEFLYI